MKVIHICSNYGGGAAASCKRLHEGLQQIGVDSQILFFSIPPADNTASYHSFIKNESQSAHKRIKLEILRRYFWQRKLWVLKSKVKGYEWFSTLETRYPIHELDIVKNSEIVNIHVGTDFIDYRLFFNRTKNYVFTLHDANACTGGCHYPSGCSGYLEGCITCPQIEGIKDQSLAHKNLVLKQKANLNRNIKVISPSQWLFNLASHSTVFKGHKIYHVPYGIDLEVFKPMDKKMMRGEYNLDSEKKYLIFVAENPENTRKGIDILFKSIRIIRERKLNFGVLVVGGEIKEEFQDIEIIELGFISDTSRLAQVYNCGDLFVIPSREDNLPNTVLEALSCGIPVIGFNSGGIPDMIKDGYNGFLADDPDPVQLAYSIEKFLNLPNKKVREMKVASRKYAEEKYGLRTQAYKHLDIYKSFSQK